MKHRISLGFTADVAESAALTLKDEFSEGRIYDAVDYDYRRRKDRSKIESALRRLNTKDRAFARAVLRGRTRLDFGLSRQAFCNKLKKVCDCLEAPVKAGRKCRSEERGKRLFC